VSVIDAAPHVSPAESAAFCQALTRRAAKNFYYGLKLLPEPKRSAMYALYAYMRVVDDIADEPDGRSMEQREAELQAFRATTHAALAGHLPPDATHPMWPAFVQLGQQFHIPPAIFDDMIEGQLQDLQPVRIATFSDLHAYCYRVASVVGLASLYVWGFEGGRASEALAIDRGIAFQLTNVLRDLREDAQRRRIYLPADELAAAGIDPAELHAETASPKLAALLKEQVARAESYYQKSAPLDEKINADSRPTLRAMTDIYHGILRKIAADPAVVLTRRISLSPFAKIRIAWRAVRAR
jgi:phytoene synthase